MPGHTGKLRHAAGPSGLFLATQLPWQIGQKPQGLLNPEAGTTPPAGDRGTWGPQPCPFPPRPGEDEAGPGAQPGAMSCPRGTRAGPCLPPGGTAPLAQHSPSRDQHADTRTPKTGQQPPSGAVPRAAGLRQRCEATAHGAEAAPPPSRAGVGAEATFLCSLWPQG